MILVCIAMLVCSICLDTALQCCNAKRCNVRWTLCSGGGDTARRQQSPRTRKSATEGGSR